MSYEILCQDSLVWLKKQKDHSIKNVVTGIPDLNEIGDVSVDQYIDFFDQVAKLIFAKIKDDGYCIFIQTDRKYDGQLIDKSYILTHCAKQSGFKLVWHKIVCLRDIGKKDLFRPTYSHMLCYTKTGKPGQAFEDVIESGGKLYENATPYNAALKSVEFIANQISKQKQSPSDLHYDLIDCFVGQGTIGAVALKEGLSFLGIDIDPKQCQHTKDLLKLVSDKLNQ